MAALKLTRLREEGKPFVYRTPQSIHIITSDFLDLGRQKRKVNSIYLQQEKPVMEAFHAFFSMF